MTRGQAINFTLFLLRVVAGLIFMQSGGVKILGWFGGIPPEHGGPPELMSQTGIGGLMELIGGAMIILGLLTRPVAFILSGEMAVAYWQFHYKPEAFWPQQNGGTPAVLFCFIFLFLSAFGGGKWSLDELIFRKRSRPAPADG